MFRSVLLIAPLLFITACAGSNPNPGEHHVDLAWSAGNFQHAFAIAKPAAERGEPWAQLRLGIFYANGWGVEMNKPLAEYWYKKAAIQKANGGWAEGKSLGAFGKAGFFDQNKDALIAKFNLAQLYYHNDMKLKEALDLVDNVIQETKGGAVFFCCEFSGGRNFTPTQFTTLKHKIKKKIM